MKKFFLTVAMAGFFSVAAHGGNQCPQPKASALQPLPQAFWGCVEWCQRDYNECVRGGTIESKCRALFGLCKSKCY